MKIALALPNRRPFVQLAVPATLVMARDACADEPTLPYLVDDPWETRNLYKSAEHAGVLRRYRKYLADWESKLTVVKPTKRPW